MAKGLETNESLISLDLSSNALTLDSFEDICNCLLKNKIRILKLKNNLLGDESMKYFANKILHKESTSDLIYFDFSSCKIYDQGLVYLISKIVDNEKIKKIKLKDNYFSHEIDNVVLDFIEKNVNLILFDLKKNRFSFQCLGRIQRVIDRNLKVLNDKEPNKLLVEVYRLKYENTKLNEMKDALKYLENDVEKIKLNRADLRQEYENVKKHCDEEFLETKKKIDKVKFLLDKKLIELKQRNENLDTLKLSNNNNLEILNNKLLELKTKNQELETENENSILETEQMEKNYIIKIEEMNNKISAKM